MLNLQWQHILNWITIKFKSNLTPIMTSWVSQYDTMRHHHSVVLPVICNQNILMKNEKKHPRKVSFYKTTSQHSSKISMPRKTEKS